MRQWIAASAALGLIGACSPLPAPEPAAPAPDAAGAAGGAQMILSDMTIPDALTECAGVYAARGNVDLAIPPQADTPDTNAAWTMLALMDKEPGLEGAAGRAAASDIKAQWLARAPAELEARAAECDARFAPQ